MNNEGRAQRFYQVFYPGDSIKESWRWLGLVMNGQGKKLSNLDDFINALVADFPQLQVVKELAPDASFRILGQKIPRQSHRYSGRTAMLANIDVSEPKPPQDDDSPLSFTMEGFTGQAPSPLLSRFWYPGWNSNQAVNKFQIEVGGGVHGGDPGKRVFEVEQSNNGTYFDSIPAKFEARADSWLAVPVYPFYGSDELSVFTPGVAELTPKPFVLLNEEEAQKLNAQTVTVQFNDQSLQLPVKASDTFPQGMVGLPIGLPEMDFVHLPNMVKITG